ncbi:hypothetical protein GALMADRAFT_129242 [Galerina marginata CBS 339.88]|uniref:Uncharacterized protein n=1 Tax=Galerina marginata (strain CBS 339.88) TaxID=685588 RepID=A0A067SCC8_GALM3|nr:hypothetical protein GALMADRAFT_129242 [Galerina marginata CBS 339.88]
MSQMFCRERRSWTAKEDQLLREAVQKEDPDNSNPSKWHAIAKHVPNRTNKDCRKRWFAKMASDVVKGGWAPDEDEKLVKGIERYGTRWSLVASVVQTRNSDQCAKRWTDTLNPAIDRTTWSSEADELLLRAVAEHGKVWTKIVKTYFPGRTGLSAKNRYNSITRFNSDLSRSARPRRKSTDVSHYAVSRKAESVSSSSSSASPESPPPMSLPYASPSSFPTVDAKGHPYRFETFSNWSSSSSVTSDDVPSFRSSPIAFDYLPDSNTSPSTPSTEGSYQSYELSLNQTLTAFSDPSHIVFSASSSPIPPPTSYKNYPAHASHPDSQNFPSYSQYPLSHGPSDLADQYGYDGIPTSDAANVVNVNWESASHSKVPNSAYKLPPSNDFSYVF